MSTKIIGCGGYLPERVVTNNDLASFIDTSDEWIKQRTGIGQRHIAADNEYCSNMALAASKEAIKNSGILSSDIDLIIVCTTTPDNSFPSVASKLQGYLNLGNTPSFDLQAVCSGFIYGLEVAHSLIVSGKYKTILLVCSEKMSSLLDWQERKTSVLFGDGAGALILQRDDENVSGVVDTMIHSNGRYYDVLYTNGGVSTNTKSGTVQMQGQELFRHAINNMATVIEDILKRNNLKSEDIVYFVPHQANIRIINALANKIGLKQEKIHITVDKHANCSAASIPLALVDLHQSRQLQKGDLLLFAAIGAGLTWGAALLKW